MADYMLELNHTLPTNQEYEYVQSLVVLDQEEREVAMKELVMFLGHACSAKQLLVATDRISHLYTRARVHQITGQVDGFKQSEVDIVASAALIALEQHPDYEEAFRTASRLRKDRNASTMSHSSHISPIHEVGIQVTK